MLTCVRVLSHVKSSFPQSLPSSLEEAVLGSLWGNKVDLSMLVSQENVGAEQLQAADDHLLINEWPEAKMVLEQN